MAFWTEDDVLNYIQREGIEIAPCYGDIVKEYGWWTTTKVKRTGCVFCGFGLANRTETRFRKLSETHPKLYDYCMKGGEWINNPDYDPTLTLTPNKIGWIPWNPKKLWVPTASGLGMKYVFDCVNAIYGQDTIKY